MARTKFDSRSALSPTLAHCALTDQLLNHQTSHCIWYEATIWNPRPISLYLHRNYLPVFAGFLFYGPSLTRARVCNLLVQLLLRLVSAVTVRSKSRRTWDHLLLTPSFESGFAFVARCDSQGYGGGIATHLHADFYMIYKFVPYLTGNILHLRYRAQTFTAV
jgi:hypothetical protein